MSKPRKRQRGAASVPCPKCDGNSSVVITGRVEEAVVRTRRCLTNPRHTFKTKEVVING
jgi:hypothetical protein